MLERFLTRLKEFGIDPEFTLTDKDFSEINTMAATWPDAKEQLCFWHSIWAIKQCLCKNKDTPAPYDAAAAKHEFAFIDLDFIPAMQRSAAGMDPVHACIDFSYPKPQCLTAILVLRSLHLRPNSCPMCAS